MVYKELFSQLSQLELIEQEEQFYFIGFLYPRVKKCEFRGNIFLVIFTIGCIQV